MPELQKIDIAFNINEYRFDSGNKDLNEFFYNRTIDFIKGGYSQVYILKENTDKHIIGYFAISCCQIEFTKELLSFTKKVRYIPGLLIGQLAIDIDFQNRKFGTFLLTKAIKIGLNISKKVGCRIMVVDASTNLRVINFYKLVNFKFVKKSLGEKIEQELQKTSKSKYNTVKMYFDLNDITTQSILP